ncbi:MAG: YraN family protein [Agarilytica sp.]
MFKRQTSKDTGDKAEKLALAHLQQHGLTLIAQNYHCKFGEVDLIVEDKNTLVFVEVRFRKSDRFGSALESVTKTKQEKIVTTARHYLAKHTLGESRPIRFDVIGITAHNIEWIKHAF